MKTFTAQITNHLGLDNTTIASFVKFNRRDDSIFGFTDCDESLEIDISDGDGPIEYNFANAYIKSQIKIAAGFSVPNVELISFENPGLIDIDDVRAGVWDFAEFRIFLANWASSSSGIIPLNRGRVGNIKISEKKIEFELLGLANKYNQEVVRPITTECRHKLGDGTCRVALEPNIWSSGLNTSAVQTQDARVGTRIRPSIFNDRHYEAQNSGTTGASEPIWQTAIGSITNDNGVQWKAVQAKTIEAAVDVVTDNQNFTLTYSGSAPDALLKEGLCIWQTGQNIAVLPMEVIGWDLSTKSVTLFQPMPFDISNGDTLKIRSGCDKLRNTCITLFDNIYNYGGYADVPGNDLLFDVPRG